MQVELNKDNRRKRHLPTPVELEPMADKYATEDGSLINPNDVDPKDVETLIEEYGKRTDVDLYTLCDVLNISRRQLRNLLTNEQFCELYESARNRRAESVATKGLEVAGIPFNKMLHGEEVSKEFVVAARNYSNYMLAYAQTFSTELGGKKNKDKNQVNIQINIPKLPQVGE